MISEDFPTISEGLRILSEILRRARAPLYTLVIVIVKKVIEFFQVT